MSQQLTIAAAPVAASADTEPPTSAAKVLFSDDFTSGFSTAPGGRWVNDFGGVDGKTTTSARGLQVLPAGVNPATHLPAFTVTSPQSSGDKLGFADHTKYMATPAVTTNEGLGGFDVPSDGALTCTTTDLAVTTTGTAANPFGKNVTNPGSDPRLGSGSANSFDPANDTVFDFFTTNTEIYAYYERLRLPGTTYAAFTYAVPVASTTPGRANTYQVTIGNHQSTATWILNGNPVLTVNKIGTRGTSRQVQAGRQRRYGRGRQGGPARLRNLDIHAARRRRRERPGPGARRLGSGLLHLSDRVLRRRRPGAEPSVRPGSRPAGPAFRGDDHALTGPCPAVSSRGSP